MPVSHKNIIFAPLIQNISKMKRIVLFTAMMFMLSSALVSCEALDALKNYEESLSLTIEEEEALLKGKWILNDAGYSLYSDETYDVERIDKDGYPEVSSAIESIIIGADGTVTFNFKEPVTFEMNPYQPTGTTYETFETYTVTDDVMMRLGFDGEGVEYFLVQEDRAGGVECDFTLYGVEKLSGDYSVNRMIMSAGTVGEDFYYEFVPAKE